MAIRNLDIDTLRTFAAIAEAGSFTLGGQKVYRNQSTVSLQIKRLEEAVGAPLFQRTTRRVRLTTQGEAALVYAMEILKLNDEMLARLTEPGLEGVVRLGAPEDFATTHLPRALARFAKAFPQVQLEVTCDLTLNLVQSFERGELDIVLVKREPGGIMEGVRVWREPLVWVAADRNIAQQERLPLVVAPPPCVYRKRAAGALDAIGVRWRPAYTCASLAGIHAAVRAGLGLTVLPRGMTPVDLFILDAEDLPVLPDTEIALMQRDSLSRPAARLAEHIVRSLEGG
ncbi:MAG: LysR substrate-binding domain-containing protein [Caulobacterales bacterium]|jgi:DNA-binding transcriptional LysR family regulator